MIKLIAIGVIWFILSNIGMIAIIGGLTGFQVFNPLKYNWFYGLLYIIGTGINAVIIYGSQKEKWELRKK